MKDHSMTNPSNSAPALYTILMGSEYAALTVRDWRNQDGSFGGEARVYSHLGDFGGIIASCDKPIRAHLVELGMADFFAKCEGAAHMTFDGPASVAELCHAILGLRRARSVSADVACELWGDLQFCRDTAAQSELSFRSLAARLCALEPALGQPAGLTLKSLSPQATHFWNTIWPEVTRMLTAEQNLSLPRLAA